MNYFSIIFSEFQFYHSISFFLIVFFGMKGSVKRPFSIFISRIIIMLSLSRSAVIAQRAAFTARCFSAAATDKYAC